MNQTLSVGIVLLKAKTMLKSLRAGLFANGLVFYCNRERA
jgi:hypothetical protein